MKWSRTFIFTMRDAPNDAELTSHKLLARSGLVRKIAPGIFVYQDLALRTIRKIEAIVRSEMNKYASEILMPMVQPKELWEETNRWSEVSELLRFKNRADQYFCLGGTHEEVATDVVRSDVKSYRDLPKFFFQIQTKYRDEIRPRYGLMRAREFIMKDAYSFDTTQEEAYKSYDKMFTAYNNIFKKMGLDYRSVTADAGNIGGSKTQEFQVLADAGEDQLLVAGELAYNVEVAPLKLIPSQESAEIPHLVEEFATPGLKTIEDLSVFLKVPQESLVKTLFLKNDENEPMCVLLRGSDELNPVKLKNFIKSANPPQMLTDSEVRSLTKASPGSCGPLGLQIPIYVDQFLTGKSNYIVGANKDGFHKKNVCPERDFKVTAILDLRLAKEGDVALNGELYKSYKGIEVGHIFYLGTQYSQAMRASFLDKNGRPQWIEMGCYGIGVSRTLQAAIEQNHDADGIVWPKEIAPYHVHICLLDPKDSKLLEYAETLEKDLEKNGFDVLLDDRDERPGIKFKDADLMGFPIRINIGKKGFDANEVDIILRKTKEQFKLNPNQALDKILEILK